MDTTLVIDSLQNLDSLVVNLTLQPQITNVISDEGNLFSDPGTILAVIAIVVSIVTIIITTWYNRKTLILTKEHNKLSVQPILCFERELKEGKNIICTKLLNNGFGPAFIKQMTFLYNNENFNNVFEIIKIIDQNLYLKSVNRKMCSYMTFKSNPSIKADSEIELFKVVILDNIGDRMLEILKKINIRIDFYDLYKEEDVAYYEYPKE